MTDFGTNLDPETRRVVEFTDNLDRLKRVNRFKVRDGGETVVVFLEPRGLDFIHELAYDAGMVFYDARVNDFGELVIEFKNQHRAESNSMLFKETLEEWDPESYLEDPDTHLLVGREEWP